jgi:monofunctional chorismate mutase
MSRMKHRVAFQGELGAYSEEAVRRHWGNRAEPVPARSCADVARAVSRGDVEYGLLPIENTLAGSVVGTYDALAACKDVTVVGEVILPIHHCLLALPGASLDTLATVESHPVALAQCTRFLDRHPHIHPQAAYDTAGAARDVAARGEPTHGAIAGRGAAERFGLSVLAADIEDRPDNQTRFLALAREPVALPPGVPARTALIATTPNVPGALLHLLAPIADAGLNLSKLESRPTGEPWTYSFFIEIEHESDEPEMDAVLAEMGKVAGVLRVVGTWERGNTSRQSPVASNGSWDRDLALDAVQSQLATDDWRLPPRDWESTTTATRAIRGAISVDHDDEGSVLEATRELLREIVARNAIEPEQVISALFTMTPDLRSTFPAFAARELGWTDVPLLCMSEIPVPGSLPRCVRVLLHVEVPTGRARMRHVYLREAVVLRPDWGETAVAGRA